MIEEYKEIKGYNGDYFITNYGNVWSLKKSDPIKLKFNIAKGYSLVRLFKCGKTKTVAVHVLVAIYFLDYTPSSRKIVINHKDFDRSNNRLDNLEIITARENTNKKHIKSTSKYIGVYWNKSKHKWVSQIEINKKKIYLGAYKSEYEAHLAYQKELSKI